MSNPAYRETELDACLDCGRTLQSSRDIDDWERFDSGDCSRSYFAVPDRVRHCYEMTIAKLRARVADLERDREHLEEGARLLFLIESGENCPALGAWYEAESARKAAGGT